MKTTYIKLFAGLGNQIFQYIYGRYLELQGTRVRYLIARPRGKTDRYIDFPGVFYLSEAAEQQLFMADTAPSRFVLILKKIYAKYICHAYETGFYQDVGVVENVAASTGIHSILRFKREGLYSASELCKVIRQTQTSVSIHIRGGDYLGEGSPFAGICTADYYAGAIEYMLRNTENPHFFIFTNDTEFADSLLQEIQLPKGSFTYVTDSPEFASDAGYDMFLMSCCRHNIIANSTYSWWAAYLNQNQNKIVVTPPVWTKDNNPTLEELKPASWIAL